MSIRRLASETAVYGVSSVLGRGMYFLLTPLYTGFFEPFELGIQTQAYSVLGLLLVVAVLRLDVAYFRFAEDAADEGALLGTSFLAVLATSGALGLALLLGSPAIAEYLGYPAYRGLFALTGGILFFDALCELPLARLRMQGRAVRFAAVRLGGIAVNLGLNVFWIYLLPRWPAAPEWLATPLAGISYIFLANVVASAFTFALVLPELRGVRLRVDGALLRRLLAFSAPLVVVGLSFIVNETFDRQMFPLIYPGTREEGIRLLGVYGQNYKLAMLLALFTQAFRYGAEPFFFRERGAGGAEAKYARLARYYLIAALVGFVGVCAFLPALSQVLLRDPAYRAGSDVVPILLLANLCLGLYYNFAVWYKVTDNTRFGAYISLGGAAVTVLLNLALIPRYGFYGCAWATLACYAAMLAATWALGRSRYPVPYRTGRMLGYTALAVGLVGLYWGLSPKLAAPVLELAVEGAAPGVWAASLALGAAVLLAFCGALFALERRLRRSGGA